MMFHILWVIFTYFIGSIPFGLILATYYCDTDPRSAGSHNVGATNVARLCGKKCGILTLICDLLKGALPVAFAYSVGGAFFVTCTALAAVFGHVFSFFLKYKGGKAVATSVGVFLPIAFGQLVVAVLICLACIWFTGFVSAGSLALVVAMPILLFITGEWALLPLSLLIAGLVVWTHRENVSRLMSGTEKSWKKSEYKE